MLTYKSTRAIKAMNDGNTDGSAYTYVVASLKKQRSAIKKKNSDTDNDGKEPVTKFDQQATAANRQIATIENKNMVDYLRLVQEKGIYSSEELKGKKS